MEPIISPQSILIVKTSAIGDVIQSFEALEYLRAKFPDARIDWVVEHGIAPLLRAHPMIDHVIELKSKIWRNSLFKKETRAELSSFSAELRKTEYDVLFDLQGNTKSAAVTACAKAKCKVGYGWKSVRERSNLLVTNRCYDLPSDVNIRLKYLGLVKNHFNDSQVFHFQGVRLNFEKKQLEAILNKIPRQPGPKFMVCFGSKWANKKVAEEAWIPFLEKVAADCDPSFIFIFGDEEERRFAEKLSTHFTDRSIPVGNLSLPLWQGLMWEMDGVFAVDSAALHLCATTQTPSLSIFGPSLASTYKPPHDRHLAIQGSCPYGRSFTSRCPILRTCPTGACMRNLHVDELFKAYQVWFKKSP